MTSLSLHEPHYDVLSAAVAGTASTMLTLLAMLGGSGAILLYQKMLFDSQLGVLELALIAGVAGLLQRRERSKRTFSHVSAALLITGTILVSLGAALPIT
jgi:hypothetical protein